MPVDIGPRIGIDGEAEFRKELANINQQLRTLGSEMQAVTSSFDANDKSQEALSAQSDVLTRQIAAQEEKLAQLRKGLEAAAEKYGENDTKTLKWAQAVNNATTDLNKLRTNLSKVESEMDGTASAADDLAAGTKEAGDAAKSTGSRFGALDVTLGSLAASGIAAAASAIGSLAGNLIGLDESTEEYRMAQGQLNTAFEAAGYGPETAGKAYEGFFAILGDTGTATEASQLLAKLAQSEEDVVTWTGIAAGVSGTFGDALPVEGLIEAANETAKVGEVTGTLADALNWAGIGEDAFNEQLAACSTEQERNQLIMDTLASTYSDAAAAFYENNEALVQARENEAALNEITAGLGETISVMKNNIFAQFLPALQDLGQAFNGLLQGEEGAGAELGQAVQGMIDAFLGVVSQAVPRVLETGMGLLRSLADGIEAGLPDLLGRLPQVLSGFLSYFTEHLPEVLAQGVEMVNSLVNGILDSVPVLLEALPELITAFVGFVSENLPKLLDAGVDMLLNLVQGILDTVPRLVEALPELITAVTSGLAELFPNIVQTGGDLLRKLWDGIFAGVPGLVENLPEIIAAIVEGLEALMNGIVDVGLSIVEGLWEGIKSGAGWLKEKITGWANDILDSITGFFGIHSPSTVFRDEVGRYLAQGIGVGFASEMDHVARQMQQAVPTLDYSGMEQLSTGLVNGIRGAVSSGGGGSTGPIVIPVYLDRCEIARAVFDPLNDISRTRGEPLGQN